MRVRMLFAQSLRGLEDGAPVDLLGVDIGNVRSDVAAVRAAQRARCRWRCWPTSIRSGWARCASGSSRPAIRAARRPAAAQAAGRPGPARAGAHRQPVDRPLVRGAGVHAQAPRAWPSTPTAPVPTLPTVPGALADVQPQLAEIVARLSRGALRRHRHRPAGRAQGGEPGHRVAADHAGQRRLFDQAAHARGAGRGGRHAPGAGAGQQTLASAQATCAAPRANVTDAQAPLQRNANQALAELQRAAQALRVLADYLQRHPESIAARQARRCRCRRRGTRDDAIARRRCWSPR